MAESDILGAAGDSSDIQDARELEWVVAKSLLDANAHSTQAFEHYLLQTLWSDDSSDLEPVGESIHQAIQEHEKIIEHLELAADAVSELRDDDRA